MATAAKATMGPRMSDEAVKAKTGKTWKEWFAILDQAGAIKLTHQEIVKQAFRVQPFRLPQVQLRKLKPGH